jgi:hypothetical protein
MAVRKPLYFTGGNFREMTTSMVAEIVAATVYQYSLIPSVVLSVVSSSGTLAAITDTRKKSGTVSSTNSAFPNEATTGEPGTVTVTYDKISHTNTSVTPTADSVKLWPVYAEGTGSATKIRAMTLADIKDTFLHPAIDLLTAATTTTAQAGTYFIDTSSSALSTSTLVSSTAVFVDTRADVSAYTAGNIGTSGTTQDHNEVITSYYLHRVNGASPTYTEPYFIDSNNDIKEYTASAFNTLIKGWIRYTAASSSDGYAISYNIGASGSGSERGSGIADTILNGAGAHTTNQVGDDYRAQEFPNGTATTAATYYLRIHKS